MKKIISLICLVLLISIAVNTNFSLSASSVKIYSTDWMKELPDDLRITDLNIPGVHDAGTAHTTATVSSQYTICQHYYIGNQLTKIVGWFDGSYTETSPGLLQQGVRYFDIRFDLHDFDPEDDDDLNDALAAMESGKMIEFAAEHLELCHGAFTCRYLESNTLGWHDWEDVTGTKLLSWLNAFLTNHDKEVVILDISAEDEDEKSYISEFVWDIFSGLALKEVKGFPSVYYGKRVPTLGDARGKLVILGDLSTNYKLYDGDGSYIGNWAFKCSYGRGDEINKTYGLINQDNLISYQVYKNNQYDGVDEDEKWEWVENGLNDAEGMYNKAKADGYSPFFLNYTSANDITNYHILRSPQGFAEDINPKVYDHIYNYNQKKEWHYYGILAMDFMNDPRYGADMANQIWSSNFYRDYNFAHADFSGIDFEYVDNSPKTGTSIGTGNIYIIIGGIVIIVGVTIAAIIIVKKKKKKANA